MPFVGRHSFLNERCPSGSRKQINFRKNSFKCVNKSGKVVKKLSPKSYSKKVKVSKKSIKKATRKSPVYDKVLKQALSLQKSFKKKCRKQTDSIKDLKSFSVPRLRSTMNRWKKVMKDC